MLICVYVYIYSYIKRCFARVDGGGDGVGRDADVFSARLLLQTTDLELDGLSRIPDTSAHGRICQRRARGVKRDIVPFASGHTSSRPDVYNYLKKYLASFFCVNYIN